MVKGSASSNNSATSRIRVNTSEENRDVQPEDFDVESHQNLLMKGMNQLRLNDHLLDVKLKAEGKVFKVRQKKINFHMVNGQIIYSYFL